MSYLSVRDSFCTYLAEMLEGNSIPFHWFLFDGDNPTQDRLKLNTVNVSFLEDDSVGSLDVTMVSVDIIHAKERTAIAWQDYLTSSVLRKYCIVRNQDMATDPDNPVPLYGYISWNTKEIRWINVDNPNYCHFNTTFDIYHVIPPNML
jgi:hypothetical protein